MASAKSVIETSTNIALLTVCCLLGCLFVSHRDLWLHGKVQTPSDSSLMGEVLTQLPEYDWKSHEMTLVVAMRSDCHFCQASMPFYKHLAELQADNRFRCAPISSHARSKSCQPFAIRWHKCAKGYMNFRSIQFTFRERPHSRPVDASGRVDRAWVGLLTPCTGERRHHCAREVPQSTLREQLSKGCW